MTAKLIVAIGMSTSEMSVSFTLTPSIEMTVKMTTRLVELPMRIPKPVIWRTALRSFVRRAIRSPMRWCWKYARCIRSRWAKRSLRIRYSRRRDESMMLKRPNPRTTFSTAARAIMRSAS